MPRCSSAANALLFTGWKSALRTTTEQIISAQPMLGTLADGSEPAGVRTDAGACCKGYRDRQFSCGEKAQLASALAALGNAAEAASALQIAPLDWSRLFTGREPVGHAMRRFVLVQPVLDYTSLAPAQRRHHDDPRDGR